MGTLGAKEGTLTVKVQVSPRAKRSEIVGEHNGTLRMRISAAPVDGAANEELIRLLARTFKISRSSIEIKSGHTSKLKTVRITGVTDEMMKAVLSAKKS